MSEEEKRIIDLESIKSVYETSNQEFLDKIKKGYKKSGNFSALEWFANDLDNFYWATNEYIKRAELIHANYDRKELLDTLEAYTTEFIEFYKDKKEETKEFEKIDKKIKGYDYIKLILN